MVCSDPARRPQRRCRGVCRGTLLSLVLVATLAAASGVSAAVVGGSTAGAAVARNSAILPIRPCGSLTSERLVSPTRVPVRILSARLVEFTGAEYCSLTGRIGADFSFDLRLPRSTFEGEYVQEGCGGFCGYLSLHVPLVADNCPAVTGNTLALAVDNEGHETTSNTDARLGGQRHEQSYRLRLNVGTPAVPRGQVAHRRLLRSPSRLLILRRVLRRRTRGTHRGPAISARLQRDPGRGTGQYLLEQIGEVGTWNIRVNTGPRSREILTSEKLPALHAAVVRACGEGRGYVLDPRTCDFSPVEHRVPWTGHRFLPDSGAGSTS